MSSIDKISQYREIERVASPLLSSAISLEFLFRFVTQLSFYLALLYVIRSVTRPETLRFSYLLKIFLESYVEVRTDIH